VTGVFFAMGRSFYNVIPARQDRKDNGHPQISQKHADFLSFLFPPSPYLRSSASSADPVVLCGEEILPERL
jgi:hypothetical protein